MKLIDLAGKKYGKLTVVWPVGRQGRHPQIIWLCVCEDGNLTCVSGSNLRRGNTTSCGCIAFQSRSETGKATAKHGQARADGTREYRAYINAKSRCNNPKDISYKYYGGRGIEFRFGDFESFFAAIGPRPSTKHSVDRIENSGHYEPGNVRWATRSQQNSNKRMKGCAA